MTEISIPYKEKNGEWNLIIFDIEDIKDDEDYLDIPFWRLYHEL